MNCIDTMGPPAGDLVISNHSTLWTKSGSSAHPPQWEPLHTILDDNAYRVKVPRRPGTAADLGKMSIESCQITAPITTGLDLQTLGPPRDSRVSTQIRS